MRPNDGILITRDVTGAIKQLAAVSISLRHPETRARAPRMNSPPPDWFRLRGRSSPLICLSLTKAAKRFKPF